MKIFLICPVRNVSSDEQALIADYVAWLEASGEFVYWPARDTDQSDAVGLKICASNRSAMETSDEVHVWWNPDSIGSVFDLGMAFALRKPVIAANSIFATAHKSFANVIRELDPNTIR